MIPGHDTDDCALFIQDDWDSDFDEESVSQVGGPGGQAPGQNNYAQHQASYLKAFGDVGEDHR